MRLAATDPDFKIVPRPLREIRNETFGLKLFKQEVFIFI